MPDTDSNPGLDRLAPSSFRTFSGRVLDFANPQPSSICLTDIAVSLARQCRFNGHVEEFYSVAQHSVLVSRQSLFLAERAGLDLDVCRKIAVMGLMHDAAEAYVGDCVAPVKQFLQPSFDEIETRVQKAIQTAIGFEWLPEHADLVKQVDVSLFLRESIDLRGLDMKWAVSALRKDMTAFMPHEAILRCWRPDEAGRLFLAECKSFGMVP